MNADPKNDKNEELENPGRREDDRDIDIDDGMDIDEPEVVGSRHDAEDPESGKNLGKSDDDMIPQDSDPSE